MRERALSLRGIAWGIAVGGIVVLVVVVAILFGRRPKEDADADPVPGEPPPNTALRELARDWNCTPIELGRSLLRAANWDRREEADAIGLDAVLADGEILAILNRIEASNDTDRFLVSPAVEREGGFRRFLTGRGMETPSDVLAQRRWLFLTWQSFSELRQSGSRARSFLREIDGGDAFSRFIIMAAEIELDTGTGNGFREPTTPLFDQQDVMVYRMLGDVRHLMDDAGLTLLLMSGGDGEADLPKFVSMLEESRDTIPGALVESRRSAIDKISLEGVGVVRNDAYVDLKNFLLQLTSFARL